jgi:CheY-like chemotaxis protein
VTRVLVVDDDPQLLQLYVTSLTRAGYEPITAQDGAEAMQRMGSRPAVVLLDLEMPNANGYEFLEQIRGSPEHASIPVIVISGTATGEWALRVGATEFMAKPFKVTEVLDRIRRYAPPAAQGRAEL